MPLVSNPKQYCFLVSSGFLSKTIINQKLRFSMKMETCTLISEHFPPVRKFFFESLSSCTVIKDCTIIRDIRVGLYHQGAPEGLLAN